MATARQLEAAKLYSELMAEVKIRLRVTADLAGGKYPGVPGRMARECCYLQLRMVCELIALGCLLLHGDIKATQAKDIAKTWNAADLIARLEALHPRFYPVPSTYEKTAYGGHFAPVSHEYLTKDALLQLVGRCGSVLHRGNMRQLLREKPEVVTALPDVTEWGRKIIALLVQHVVLSRDELTSFVCILHHPQTQLVHVVIAESTDTFRSPGGPIPGA